MIKEKSIQKGQSFKNVQNSTFVWLLGFLCLVSIEIIFRIIKGPPPLASIMLITVLVYCGVGLGTGFCSGVFTSLMLKIRGKVIAHQKIETFCIAFCISTVNFFYGILLINEHLLGSSSDVTGFLSTTGFVLLCLCILIVLYVTLDRLADKSHLFSSFLALAFSFDLFLVGGVYINENLLPGRFFTFNLISIIANSAIIITCILFYFLFYFTFRFLSDKIPRFFHFKATTLALIVILIVGLIVWNINSDSIPTFKEASARFADKQKEKPNVILISLDTTRADHLSCYGYHRKTTPNLDRFAEEGLLFRNAYSTASWTLPAHASLFTGLYPSTHGAHGRMDVWIWDMGARLDSQFTTLAEVLQNEGYITAGMIGGPYCSSHFGLAQGFDYYNENLLNIKSDLDYFMLYKILGKFIPLRDWAFRYGYSGIRIASQMNDVVFEWLDKNCSNPFFLFINYFDPHGPFAAPSPYDTFYEGKNKEIIKNPASDQKEINYCAREWGFMKSVLSGKRTMSEKEKEHFLSQYDGKISYLDFHLERLFQKLKSLRIYDHTMIIIVGDHGESFGEHQLMFHNLALYDTLLKVPLIIKYPLSMKRVGTIDYPVSLVDVLPEILSTLGIPIPDTVQGSPLRDKERKGVVAENYRQEFFVKLSPLRFDRDLRTIIKGGFKYIWTSDGRNELYNLSKDPGELKNLVNELPQKGEEMQTAMNNWLNSAKVTAPEREIQIMDERIKENLKVLGYID